MSKPTLRWRRKQLGLTLQQMADKIEVAGVDAPFLSRLERNLHRSEWVDPSTLLTIGKCYGVRLRVRESAR